MVESWIMLVLYPHSLQRRTSPSPGWGTDLTQSRFYAYYRSHLCGCEGHYLLMKSHPTTDTNHNQLGPKWYEDKQQEDDTTQAWQCDMLPRYQTNKAHLTQRQVSDTVWQCLFKMLINAPLGKSRFTLTFTRPTLTVHCRLGVSLDLRPKITRDLKRSETQL